MPYAGDAVQRGAASAQAGHALWRGLYRHAGLLATPFPVRLKASLPRLEPALDRLKGQDGSAAAPSRTMGSDSGL